MPDTRPSTSWIFASATAAMLLWSLLVGYSLYWNTTNLREGMVRLATTEARDYWNKDMAFRRWASRHGGVYVKPDARTPPNPNLAHLPNRDLTLEDGTKLTLMNPAYMLRQLSEEEEATIGIKGKATGLLVLDPNNRPDKWETKVLQRFEKGEKEVVEESTIDGQPYIRYMKVVMMEKNCVKCHGVLGFKEGDVRGGISVSIPLTSYFDEEKSAVRSISFAHLIVWIFGLCGIVLFFTVVRARQIESQRLIRQIEHDALHDVLTGLPNRQLFLDRIAHSLARTQTEEGYQFAVCSVDLDRFKMINDSHGHALGDRVLQEIGRRLQRSVGPSDTVARLGGDEFNLLLERVVSLESTLNVAERVLEAIREVIVIDGVEIHTSASIGVSCTTTCYKQAQEIVRDADIALSRAKDEGKGRIEFFNPMMHQRAVTILKLESALHEALAREELSIHYQPIVNSHNNTIGGFEALIRWYHPQMGNITPGEFIPVAEAVGLIDKLGDWVLHQACSQIHQWNQRYGCKFFVSVNFSAKQIANANIVETVRQALHDSQLPAGLLHCEVTETTLVHHPEHAASVLDALRQLGVRISIDDFGTGYSSLTYLHQFCFDILKIDKSFVQDMTAEGKGLQLVRMLMMLARDFNMEVIAEGVETEDQYNRLKAFKCSWIQGYYFLHPVQKGVIELILEAGYARNVEKLIDWNPELMPSLA